MRAHRSLKRALWQTKRGEESLSPVEFIVVPKNESNHWWQWWGFGGESIEPKLAGSSKNF